MIFKNSILPALIIVVCIAIAAGLVFQQDPPQMSERVLATMLVDVMKVHKTDETVTITAQGSANPKTQTTLVSEVSGTVLEVSRSFVAGGFFKKGDVLVRIDDRNYRVEVKRAQAAVAAAEVNLTRELGLADYAKQDWERSRSGTQEPSELALRTPQVVEATAGLEFAKADLEKRLGDLDRTVIRAPYDGMVREKVADQGQFVAQGSTLAKTFSTEVVEVRLPLPDRDLPFLNLDDRQLRDGFGPEVQLSASLGGKKATWQGKLIRTEGVFDERSRVLYVVAEVKDPYNQKQSTWQEPLRVGTFVDAQIDGATINNVVRLPRGALRDGNQVWTVSVENTLLPVRVNVARSDESSVLVTSGLEDNQLVCTTLLDNPLPGTPVRFVQRGAQEEFSVGDG